MIGSLIGGLIEPDSAVRVLLVEAGFDACRWICRWVWNAYVGGYVDGYVGGYVGGFGTCM